MAGDRTDHMTEQSQEIKAQIDATLSEIEKLPTLPDVVNRAIAMAYDPDVDIKLLAEEISRDPAISAGVIKLSNSAYFTPAKTVRSVHEAIVTLGLNTVKDIIIITASKSVIKVPLDAYKLEASELWDHSLIVAEIASRIAKLKKTGTKSDVAFTAGLFHDVGKVLLSSFFKKAHLQINMDMQRDPQARFSDLEKKYMGYSHNELGAKLLANWKFPEELVEAVRFHYHPEEAKVNPELSSMVHIANVVALASGVGMDVGGMNEELSKFAIDTLQITDREIAWLYHNLPELLERLFDMRSL